jgi:hypothetical protein
MQKEGMHTYIDTEEGHAYIHIYRRRACIHTYIYTEEGHAYIHTYIQKKGHVLLYLGICDHAIVFSYRSGHGDSRM